MELFALLLAFLIGLLIGPAVASILVPHTWERARKLLAETKAHHEETERTRVAAAEALADALRDLATAKQHHDESMALLAKATVSLGVVR